MARERFQIYLFNRDKKPLYVSSAGFVEAGLDNFLKSNGQPACLEYSPLGWPDFLVKYARNILYWGINRDMTVPMTFVRDGFEILKYLMWAPNGGTEAVCYIGILKLDETTLPYKYIPWYFSEINFTKFSQNGYSFKTEALEGGMSKVFKAFENTKYEIDISNHPNAVNVLFDGMTLIGKQNFLFGNQNFDPYGDGLNFYDFNFFVVKELSEGSAPGIIFLDNFYSEVVVNDLNFFSKKESGSGLSNVRIKGEVKIKMILKRDETGLYIKIVKINIANVETEYFVYDPAVNGLFAFTGEIKNILFDFNIPMSVGDRLYFRGHVGFSSPGGSIHPSAFRIMEDSVMSVDYEGKGDPTYAKGLYAKDLLEEIAKAMVGTKDILSIDNIYTVSDWLSAKTDLLILSGDSIRQLPNAKIKTSIKELFLSLNHFQCGLEIKNQKIRIELWDYFFTNDVIINLGEVSGAFLTAAEDLIQNTIVVGGPDIDYEDVNGKYEPNQLQYWATTITKVIGELDLATPYRRDPYGFEFLRLNLKGKLTTDDAADGDGWMLNIETVLQPEGHYKLNRPAFTLVEGVPAPTEIFNLLYTPKWSLINNADRLASMLDRRDGDLVTMSSALKNRELKTNLVDEDLPMQVGSFGNKKWQPYYFNFTTEVDVNVHNVLDNTPYGKVRFTVNGREWFGRMNDGSVKPGDKDAQQWKLIVAENNDLKKWYEPS